MHDNDASANELLLLVIDWPCMRWLETAAVEADDDDDEDDDGRGKRCWWHGRPFRMSTGTATRRGAVIAESTKPSIWKRS